jgi:hypothetical protein
MLVMRTVFVVGKGAEKEWPMKSAVHVWSEVRVLLGAVLGVKVELKRVRLWHSSFLQDFNFAAAAADWT